MRLGLVWLALVGAVLASAQTYPGQYPPGQYPPGQYPPAGSRLDSIPRDSTPAAIRRTPIPPVCPEASPSASRSPK